MKEASPRVVPKPHGQGGEAGIEHETEVSLPGRFYPGAAIPAGGAVSIQTGWRGGGRQCRLPGGARTKKRPTHGVGRSSIRQAVGRRVLALVSDEGLLLVAQALDAEANLVAGLQEARRLHA